MAGVRWPGEPGGFGAAMEWHGIEQCMLMADVLANLGGMLLQKNEQEADPTNPRRSH
jgi:hypothetical protein